MSQTEPTPAQIREHYLVEKELASRLRNSTRQERPALYSAMYEELFRRVPHHPRIVHKIHPDQRRKAIGWQMSLVRSYLHKNATFVELGPGDCAFSFHVSPEVARVYGVDVSGDLIKADEKPSNFQLVLSDGCEIPLPDQTADVVFSQELIEHIHPDDLPEHLAHVYRILKPGGTFICIACNRLSGPHDISSYFDSEATGFHLKEYRMRDLVELCRQQGFRRMKTYVGARGRYIRVPLALFLGVEALLEALPFGRRIARTKLGNALLNLRLFAYR
ncbi:MAG TPA: class I SAM-dependent methyltransferase [Terriglobales bacterium]|nr:class I SAM-dependent methyltransferase [Terriglobales bacterium]